MANKTKRSSGKYPGNISLVIMKRFMDEKTLESFFDKYEEVKFHRSFSIAKPSANDKAIYGHFIKVQSIGKTAAELGISHGKVLGAISRVAAYKV